MVTAIILAGGLGTRLRPLTEETPKPLLPIKGKPIVEHLIENLKHNGVTDIILSIGYKAEQIQQYFGDGEKFGVNITYSIEDEPLGTGGAIKQASKNLQNPFILLWGDNLMDLNIDKMIHEYQMTSAPLLMTLTPREDVEHFGVAKLDGNTIVSFVEKPNREDAPSNLINAGGFIVDPKVLEMLPEGKSSIEKDCFEKIASEGKISAFVHDKQWLPTDTLEKYNYANNYFQPLINFENKKIIMADVDDTTCDSCQLISEPMAQQISTMIQNGYTFAFISGTDSENLMKMISSKVKEEHHILGATGTNYTYVKNGLTEEQYSQLLTGEQKNLIFSAVNSMIEEFSLEPATSREDQIMDRGSQITLSTLGRNAPSIVKAAYDPDGNKRKRMVTYLRQFLSSEVFDIHIGGTTSVDITQKGTDKEKGIREFLAFHNYDAKDVIYFGDKIYPGGNDYAALRIVDCISVKNPEETLLRLKEL
ncbi:MAG: hypothetical protein CMH61_01215 [Nanoarchaeota archaeon]|nr:hypothetical protein [Nanoarchaeota archaeon]|tara:strand:+ start:1238 stop:2668 length:1431 start_codon:yes stop_codon:yes gene_type:complete